MEIAAIMPCRGRAEQTVENIIRLRAAAHFPYKLICISTEPEVWKSLKTMGEYTPDEVVCYEQPKTYWEAMKLGMKWANDSTHVINLANDLLPGYSWLKTGVESYIRRFGNREGLMGFNDGIHGPDHSPHFMIAVRLLDELGGWPIWYRHNYGDTEMCQRAQESQRYAKSAWAVMYHNHPVTGANRDEVYKLGDKSVEQDRALYVQRKESGWTPPRSSWPHSLSTASRA